MIKSELVDSVARRNPHLHRRDVEKIVNTVLADMTYMLAEGGEVELRGFGAFTVRHRPPKTGRNPRTGAAVHVEEKWVPYFRPGKELHERLNPSVRK
jgi:integration host factor subunit beta